MNTNNTSDNKNNSAQPRGLRGRLVVEAQTQALDAGPGDLA